MKEMRILPTKRPGAGLRSQRQETGVIREIKIMGQIQGKKVSSHDKR